MAGKGSAPRKGANQKAYENNWEKIFGKCKMCNNPHNGTGFFVDHGDFVGRVCDMCGLKFRQENNE